MTHAVRSPARRDPRPAASEALGEFGTDLSAVLESLARAAGSQVETLLSEARREASRELNEARAEAQRIIQQARAEGDESASRSAAMMSARTSRQAHEEILAARRSAVETLRRRAAEAMERRVATPEGEELIEYLRSIVHARVGLAPPPGPSGRPAAVGAITARSGNRRATADVEDLVDSVLNTLAQEVESLWD